jgi:hypothetical protein
MLSYLKHKRDEFGMAGKVADTRLVECAQHSFAYWWSLPQNRVKDRSKIVFWSLRPVIPVARSSGRMLFLQ